MKYLFRVGQRVRFTKTTNRPAIQFGTVNAISTPTNSIIAAPSTNPARTVSVLVDGQPGITVWPIKFWRPKL